MSVRDHTELLRSLDRSGEGLARADKGNIVVGLLAARYGDGLSWYGVSGFQRALSSLPRDFMMLCAPQWCHTCDQVVAQG